MWETILATVSGLGGAGLGAAGALLVQRAKRRDDAVAAEAEAGRAKAAATEAYNEVTLEIIATARVAARVWLMTSERVIADLQQGRPVDSERYDEQLQAELKEFTATLYRCMVRRAHRDGMRLQTPLLRPGVRNRPFVDELSETSQRIRDALHHDADTQIQTALADIQTHVRTTYDRINTFLIQSTEAITNEPLPAVSRLRRPTSAQLALAEEGRRRFLRARAAFTMLNAAERELLRVIAQEPEPVAADGPFPLIDPAAFTSDAVEETPARTALTERQTALDRAVLKLTEAGLIQVAHPANAERRELVEVTVLGRAAADYGLSIR
ncbi:hypothetical protein AB5J55_44385 [Streptomyces sp. R11]|uniref:Uncharacterized protein n=1 Tax=Streptomyces sp. R11 TaxID=3238625 RepID=A0AB39NDV3_9ACTN